ncbi:hypothetical protein AA313_de0208010 [Arthrobotrys entomopaga]|nr:hypothetical protein AA313_de0208010 [Arthrobotrys entomopaga]
MCPKWDRLRRANNKSAISTYEVDEDGYFGEARAVKSWHRPAAGDAEDLPEDLRTEETLMKTMDYLVHDIISTWSFTNCQNFIWDRTRSIRQDCSIQGLNSDAVIECYERIARFHIFSLQQLSHNENFQRGQELEQLSKTLISLNELYDDRRRLIKQGKRKYNQETDFEAEFRAYTLVSNLYSPLQIARAIQLPSRITETPIFKLALLLYKFAQRANHDDKNLFGNTSRSEATLNWSTHFFDLVYDPSTPYLLACLAAIEFPNIKKGAIKTIERGFPPQKRASSLNLLKGLVDASSELEVKNSVERYGLKTQEHNGLLYIDTPRRSQKSTWIAQPPPISPPFQLNVEAKRGQEPNGEFVAARFFIDEPGCYRRVISQLCKEEVDIRYHDPVTHEQSDGPVHVMQFSSSWESAGTFLYDAGEKVDEDSTSDGLFDLIQNTRNGRVPKAQADNLISYVGQRKKRGVTTVPQASLKTFGAPTQPAPQSHLSSAFRGFGKPGTPASTASTPSAQPQNQFLPVVAASSAFPSAVPTRETTPLLSQEAAATPPAGGTFGARAPLVPAFGAPASAFGPRQAQASAFGVKVGTGAVVPAFGARAGTPPVPAFGQKPTESAPAFAPAFGDKPNPISAFGAGSPAPSGTPPPSVFPPAPSPFPQASPPVATLEQQKPVEATAPPTGTGQPTSIFDVKPSAPTPIFGQQPPSSVPAPAAKPTPVSLFNQKLREEAQSTPKQTQEPPAQLFPGAQPNLNPAVPSFVPAQAPASQPPASVFDKPKPEFQAPEKSIFDVQPPRQPVTGFFPPSAPETNPSLPAPGSSTSILGSNVLEKPLTSFFPSFTPAAKPPVPLFPSVSVTPQVPPPPLFPSSSTTPQVHPPSLFPSTSTTPHVPPPQLPVLDFGAPKPTASLEQASLLNGEASSGIKQIAPQVPEPENKIPDEVEAIEEDKPESPKPRLAPSGLPLPEDVPDSHDLPPPHSLTYRDVVQPIAPEFFRKLDKSRDQDPWYPGIDSLDKLKFSDVIDLARHRQNLKAVAWHPLKLAECNPEGLPALLEQPTPDTWQLQIVCADEGKKSLDWFMHKFEHLVERDGEPTYRDVHVASSHRRGEDGCIGGLIFGCTASIRKDAKEHKRNIKHDKGVLQRTLINALRLAPKGKLQVLVLAYRAVGKNRKAELEYLRKSLGVEEFEEGGKITVNVLLLETLKDMENLDKTVKSFGVGLVEKKEVNELPNGENHLEKSLSVMKSPETNGNSKKRRELDELEVQTAKLLLDSDSNAMKRRRYVDSAKPVYIYGLPAFETPLKRPQAQKQPQKRKSVEDVSDSKKRKVKATSDNVTKALNSVSAKFDAWALPDGEDDLKIGGVSLEEFMNDWEKRGF